MLKSLKQKHNKSGFTLLEVLLSVAVIALLAGFGAPIYQSLQTRNNLDIVSNTVVQSLRRAQVLSQAVAGDATWGLYIQSESITIFRGTGYLSRDTAYDEIFDIPNSITPSGINEIVYSKFTGIPQDTGTIILSSNTNESISITINEKGTILY